jgi:16S rRNA (uracil1498-N3)-methyltransferase
MHRFFVPPELLQAEELALPAGVAQQVSRVLRLRAGARIALFCGDGGECEAELEQVSAAGTTARVLRRHDPDVELPCSLHVAVAVLKGEKLDWTVQKLTELGAARISFLLTERTVVAAGEDRWTRRLERYEQIAREAAEQSGRVRLPRIMPPRSLAPFLSEEAGEEGGCCLFLDPRAPRTLEARLRPCPDEVLLLIGPEGGFTDAESGAARDAGAQAVRLGRRILRAETAAIAAAAVAAAAAEREGLPYGSVGE